MSGIEPYVRIASHAGAAVIPYIGRDGLVEIAVQEYVDKYGQTLRHIMDKGKPGEKFLDTVVRGVREEGPKRPLDPNFAVRIVDRMPILHVLAIDDRDPSAKHYKGFVVIEAPKDMLRDYWREEPDEEEMHGPVKLLDAREAYEEMLRPGRGLRPHIMAITGLLTYLSAKNSRIASRYKDLIRSHAPWPLSTPELVAIARYLGI